MADLEEYFAGGDAADVDDADSGTEDASPADGSDTASDAPAGALATALRQYAAPLPGGGPLLELPDAKVLKVVEAEVQAQRRLAKNREESQKHWEFVLGGAQFSVLEKSEDQSVWRQIFPPDADERPEPVPNKVLDVKNKMVSQILVDTPLPKPIPDGDDDRARVAQDMTKKFLRANAVPTAMNDAQLFHDALDGLMTARSMFGFMWVDPVGGGWRPLQIKAHPQATDPSTPLSGPKLDPKTNQPLTMPDGQGGVRVITERATDPVLRYVATAKDGTKQFTTNPAAADRQWLPALRRRLLSPAQVRTLPRTADVTAAHGVVLIMYETLDEAKRRFPVVAAMQGQQLRALAKWRPKEWKSIVPEALRGKVTPNVAGVTGGSSLDEGTGDLDGGTLIFWYHRFEKIGPEYVDGGEVAVSGATMPGAQEAGVVFARDTLRDDVELDDGTTVPVLRTIPVAQWRGLNDVKGGDPFGVEPVSMFGGSNDIWAHLWMSVLEVIDKSLHANVFIPSSSPVTAAAMNRRDGTPITIEVPEDKPTYETPPQLPPYAMDTIDRIDRAINSLAATNETTNGLDSPYAVSGTAKQVAINQAKVGLRQLWQNLVSGCVQYWTACTQLAQAKLTVPQQVQLTGNDSAYKARWWVGADLVGVSRIALQPGSGTMMSPAEKAQWLAQMQTQEWLDPELAGELARSAMSDDLGLPPNVHEECINREIADWLEGPPAGWEDQYQANLQATTAYQQQLATFQQAQTAPAAGPGAPPALASLGAPAPAAPAAPPQPPQLTPLETPFAPRPNEGDPLVAKIRAGRLSRLISSADFLRFSPAWQATAADAYLRAFKAAGGATVEEQQAAQQQSSVQQTFAEFMTAVQQRALGLIETELAKATAGAVDSGSGGQAESSDGSGDGTGGTPVADLTKLIAAKNAPAEAAAGRANQAQQAALTRAHTAAENAKDRKADLAKHAITTLSKSHDAAAKALMEPPSNPVAQPVAPGVAAAPPRPPAVAAT